MSENVNNVFLAINGRQDVVTYDGPIPVKGGAIALTDGRRLRVLDILYTGTMKQERPFSVTIDRIVIHARYI